MGDYTRFTTNVLLSKTMPKEVLDVLRWLVEDDFEPEKETFPDHPFFKMKNWLCIFTDSCVYLPALCERELTDCGDWYQFNISGATKRYNDGGRMFLDWLRPYIVNPIGDMLGHSEFDSDHYPKNQFFMDEKSCIYSVTIWREDDDATL